MKYVMRIRIPDGNDLLRDPQFGKKMGEILKEVKAEAAYFTTIDGARGGFVVVNMNDASQLPALAEPFFLFLDAEIDWYPVMTIDDLAKAGPSIAAAVKKWG